MNPQIITQLAASKIAPNSPLMPLLGFVIVMLVAIAFGSCAWYLTHTGSQKDQNDGRLAGFFTALVLTLALGVFCSYKQSCTRVANSYVWAEKTIAAIQNPEAKATVLIADGSKEVLELALKVEPQVKDESVTVLGKQITTSVQQKEGFQTTINPSQLAILDKGQVKLADNVTKQLQLALER